MEVREMVRAVRKLSVLVLLVAALFCFSVAAEASTISITNQTGYAIHHIFLTDSGMGNWGECLLGDYMIPHGATLQLQVTRPFQSFDLKSIDEDGDAFEWYGFAGNTTQITLVYQ
jgi:hypothetical protein